MHYERAYDELQKPVGDILVDDSDGRQCYEEDVRHYPYGKSCKPAQTYQEARAAVPDRCWGKAPGCKKLEGPCLAEEFGMRGSIQRRDADHHKVQNRKQMAAKRALVINNRCPNCNYNLASKKYKLSTADQRRYQCAQCKDGAASKCGHCRQWDRHAGWCNKNN